MLRRTTLALITSDTVTRLLARRHQSHVAILMMHRFADPELGNAGHSPARLRRNLEYLRRNRIHVHDLTALLRGEEADGDPRPGVVFTVDDGYEDFARVAAPVFAEFDCPVTVFVSTGVVDGRLWYWWDRVSWALRHTTRTSLEIGIGAGMVQAAWHDDEERDALAHRITELLKQLPDHRMRDTLQEIERILEVCPPRERPHEYDVLSWSEIRRLEKMGVRFGPHSVTHPVLPRAELAQAATEIHDAWARMNAECADPAPVFCYPNGAYSDREVELLLGTELRAALTDEPRYTRRDVLTAGDARARLTLPRFCYADDRGTFGQIACGFEDVKERIRGWGRPARALRASREQ